MSLMTEDFVVASGVYPLYVSSLQCAGIGKIKLEREGEMV